jgi:MFS family permease
VPDGGTVRGLTAACLTASLMPLNSTMIAVAIPDIATEFGHSSSSVTQALVATYLVAAIALQSPGGKLGDRIGHWRVFSIGQALLAAGALLGYFAPDLVVLACSRVLMASGGAIVVPATLALLRLELPSERRGRAFGAFGAVMSLAAGIGPIVGGGLVGAFGWPSVFLVNLPVLAVSAVLAATARRPRDRKRTAATSFDWVGSVLLTAGLTALVIGLQAKGSAGLVVVAVGVLVLVPFGWWETRVPDPVIAFSLLRSSRFAAGTLVVALLNLVMYALLFEVPLLVHSLFALGSEATGRLLIFMMLAMVATSLVAGRLVDAYGPRPVAVGGTLVCVAGTAMLFVTDLHSSGDLRLPLILLGLGIGLANPAAQTASLTGVDRNRSGMAAGLGSSMRYLGGIAGVAILGRLLHLSGSRQTVIDAHHTVLAVFLGVLVVTLACASLLGDRQRRPEEVSEKALA